MKMNKYSLQNTVKNLLDLDEVSEIVEVLFPEILISPLLPMAEAYRFCDVYNFIAGKLDVKKVAIFNEKMKALYKAEEEKMISEDEKEQGEEKSPVFPNIVGEIEEDTVDTADENNTDKAGDETKAEIAENETPEAQHTEEELPQVKQVEEQSTEKESEQEETASNQEDSPKSGRKARRLKRAKK